MALSATGGTISQYQRQDGANTHQRHSKDIVQSHKERVAVRGDPVRLESQK